MRLPCKRRLLFRFMTSSGPLVQSRWRARTVLDRGLAGCSYNVMRSVRAGVSLCPRWLGPWQAMELLGDHGPVGPMPRTGHNCALTSYNSLTTSFRLSERSAATGASLSRACPERSRGAQLRDGEISPVRWQFQIAGGRFRGHWASGPGTTPLRIG